METELISARVKNELVLMNLIESLQKFFQALTPETPFELSEFQSASPDKLPLLYQKSLDLYTSQKVRQEGFEPELLTLKKELYGQLKRLEEEVKVRKQAMISTKEKELITDNENEIFKLDEKIANIKADLDSILKSKEASLAKKLTIEGETDVLRAKLEEEKLRLSQLRESYAELKQRRARLEEGVKKKINENTEVILAVKALEENLEKIDKEKPVLEELANKLQGEHDRVVAKIDAIAKKSEEINFLKARIEAEIEKKEAQIKEITSRKGKLEAMYAREGTLQQQLKLENEINTTLLLENEVLLKQYEFMNDKSASNSLIFLMNESLANKMQGPNELIDFLPNYDLEHKNSDTNKDSKKFAFSEFEKELKEKKLLIESLKAQMKGIQNGNGLKEKALMEIGQKISEIEDLMAISEEELGLLRRSQEA